MPIPFSKYVRITSGVIGAASVRSRELIGRLMTTNQRVSPNEILEFTTAADVGEFFGTSTDEYRRAAAYFAWVSPNINQARKISFARYTPNAVDPRIIGGEVAPLSTFQSLPNTITLQLNVSGDVITLSGLDFTDGVTSYADVASVLQTAMRAQPQLASATVQFNASTTNMTLNTGNLGPGTVSVSEGVLADALAWTRADGALLISGANATTPLDAFLAADDISDNYGSLAFVQPVTLTDYMAIGEAMNAIAAVKYQLMVPVASALEESYRAALANIGGVAVTRTTGQAGDFAEMIPMIQLAATNYEQRNSTSQYMFKQFNFPVSVSSGGESNRLDALRVNYIGETQTAGQKLAFYQRGYLMGPSTSPLDQNTYANEQWLRDYAGVEFMKLLLGLPELPANETGRAFGINTIQAVVDQALYNGVISVGKTLDNQQKASITQISGDPLAWHQVQTSGYWMDATIISRDVNGAREYVLTYTLIYSKKDGVRAIEGRHALV